MSAPLARLTDPHTSHNATPARPKREQQKLAILSLLREVGPMTDHELTWQYDRKRARNGWPATRSDSVRKRRAELKNEGRVYDTGHVSGFAGSPASIVWAAVE
ncbi:hypothetical protein A9Z40_02960 [Microbacterium arborescens]|uniref:Uncharacterized protein n=1 Tax=Microbacterium arborescens TaxID=33883 RepID=A0ABX2WI77_9MICO|nr:hypothetical protein [Microbacterium arborescens]OAZ40916.1 hypothetical protein A9Z40_02960 [Microbacterium arborescens]